MSATQSTIYKKYNAMIDANAKPQFNAKILLAEDNRTNAMMAAQMLENMGCQVDIASDGAIAFDQFKNNGYDLIFMDCMMPTMSGYDASREIRNHENGAQVSIPIVALTANAIEGAREECMEAGMSDYMTKPVRVAELAKMLSKHLPH